MNEPDTTSSTVLAGSAYRDDGHLAARQSLYHWQQPRHDLPGVVLDHLSCQTGAVLDVGCGNGKYLTRIRAERPDLTVIGLDISEGILTAVASPVAVADAANLPIANHSATAVLAMHMLYHVEDVNAALAQATRVLSPGGTYIASTNARDDKKELDELWAQAAADVLGVDRGPLRISLSNRFALDDAPAILRQHFAEVHLVQLPGTITVYEPDPVIAHLASYRTWAGTIGVPFDATLDRVRLLLDRLIDRDGEFRISCRGGILVCHV
ncbi:methyltransferase family protein [Amycolatopsis sulphurea]|uniref:Methyltransferase family protein n=1 Tax=Amycolatopsis sulphurea TaxID=76022 RepID=A0A2A9FI65_9PSEU|nr:class I SAM-dependent methyltransferase [Amycolatopsis sulphurea]PFG50200.1 methyltransferase family protein [Amycolatopsis sulphurea]